MTPELNPAQKYMLRLVLFGAGKTILHKESICEVAETHSQIRQLRPLIDAHLEEAAAASFWVPRPKFKKGLRTERIKLARADKTLRPPVWKGEARPDAETVPLKSASLDLKRLVRELGYDSSAARSLVSRPLPEGRHGGGILKFRNRKSGYQPPSKALMDEWNAALKQQGLAVIERASDSGESVLTMKKHYFSKGTVQKIVAQMRTTNIKMRRAVLEIILNHQSPSEMAEKHGVNVKTLKNNVTNAKKRIWKLGQVELAA